MAVWLSVCLQAFRTFANAVIGIRATDPRTCSALHKGCAPGLIHQDPHVFPVIPEVTNVHPVPFDFPVLDMACKWGHTV